MELQSKSLRDLLQIASDNTISGTGTEYWEAAGEAPPKTLFQKPATAEDIAKLEERLGIALPEEYKEFLGISNGFGAGAGNEDGIYNGYYLDPALYSTGDVNWNDEPYFQLPVDLLDLPYSINDLAGRKTKKNSDGSLEIDTALPLFDRVLEIGTRDIDNIWLVHPELVKQARAAYVEMYEKADDQQKKIIEKAIEGFVGSWEAFQEIEWCCIKWAAGGAAMMQGYAGFRRYSEHLVKDSAEKKP
jgi:hypothetical protein